MEAAGTSKTPVNFYQTTRRNNPEYSHLHFEQLLRKYQQSKTNFDYVLLG
jgi:hypothetical protein